MSQVSYGTITITDTTDIERIYTVYAKSANNTTVPSMEVSTWSETVSTAPGTGNYIWQRTVVEKSGTGDKTYSDPVCLTGEEGTDATEISGIEVRYGISADWNTQPSSWSADTPAYDSSKPKYWTRTRLIYDTNPVTYSDPVYTKDEALTKAVSDSAIANSIAQHANEDAQGAMAQAGSNVNSVIRLWYLTDTASSPDKPSAHVTQTSTSVTGQWTRNKPTVANYRYYYYCDEICTGGGVYSWTDVVADTLSLTSYELGLINAKIKNHWWDSNGLHFASGINNVEVTTTNANTYGYIGTLGLNGLTLGYNSYKTMELLTNALNFYQPPTIGSTTSQGNKTMSLTGNALRFYNPSDGTTEQATLDANGLKLLKGGIEAGDINTDNYIYVWSNDDSNHNIVINNSSSKTDWRIVAGNKFGVDKEGNLYAGNVNISGTIRASLDSNVYDTLTIDEAFNTVLDQAINGSIIYQYELDGETKTVYQRIDNTYYWVDENQIEHDVEESALKHDDISGELVTIRLSDGLDNSITQALKSAQDANSAIILLEENNDETRSQINSINTNISTQQQRIDALEGYVEINNEVGYIRVGKRDADSYVQIDGVDTKVAININGQDVAYMSGDRFYAPSAVVTNLYMKAALTDSNPTGSIGWVMRSNGHLSLKRIK